MSTCPISGQLMLVEKIELACTLKIARRFLKLLRGRECMIRLTAPPCAKVMSCEEMFPPHPILEESVP